MAVLTRDPWTIFVAWVLSVKLVQFRVIRKVSKCKGVKSRKSVSNQPRIDTVTSRRSKLFSFTTQRRLESLLKLAFSLFPYKTWDILRKKNLKKLKTLYFSRCRPRVVSKASRQAILQTHFNWPMRFKNFWWERIFADSFFLSREFGLRLLEIW